MSKEESLIDRLNSKLENGEISQEEYDELFEKFETLGILKKRSQLSQWKPSSDQRGSVNLEGGKLEGPASFSGRVHVDGPLECQRLSVTGSTSIDGDLTVIGKTSIVGDVEVEGHAKFGDLVSVSGVLRGERNVYVTSKFSSSGSVVIKSDLVSDGPVSVAGEFSASTVKSTSTIKVRDIFKVDGDIVAETVEIDSGDISVGGDVKGSNISIFPKLREASIDMSGADDVSSVGDLVGKVLDVIVPTVMQTIGDIFQNRKSVCQIDGNIIGDRIDISNTSVKGDVIGAEIIIGRNVTIEGNIKFKDTIKLPDDRSYRVEKMD